MQLQNLQHWDYDIYKCLCLCLCVSGHILKCVKECVCASVCAVMCGGYCGQGSPVHAGAADVEMSPVDHPEGGEKVAFGQRCHVHVVDLSV